MTAGIVVPGRRQRALTLLELLVVVALLAAMAGSAVLLGDQIEQRARHDETVQRLEAIRSAVCGPDAVTAAGELLAGGYLQDVGWMPDLPGDLLRAPDLGGAPMPALAYSARWRTWYGWRGPYLAPQPLRHGETAAIPFDGWGNDFYGWPLEGGGDRAWIAGRLSGDWTVRSPGSDGLRDASGGGIDGFARDVPGASPDQPLVPERSWVSDLSGLAVQVVNRSALDLTATQVRLRFAIPRWDQSPALGYADLGKDRFISAPFALGVAPAGAPGDRRVCAFATVDGRPLLVPHGRRQLVLVQATDGQPLAGLNAFAEVVLSRRVSPPAVVVMEVVP